MQLDYGRKADLDELFIDYQKEKSPYWKNRIERTMGDILGESGASRELRDELIRCARVSDLNRMNYLRNELRRIQAEKYNNNIQL